MNDLKILFHQGKQYIPDVTKAELPGIFRGRPVITAGSDKVTDLVDLCPMNAIMADPLAFDLGRCNFCGECSVRFPETVRFTKDYKLSVNRRDLLIVKAGTDEPLKLDESMVREEIRRYFRGSLKLRQVSASGDNSCELELNACGNVNFDMGRFGIEFVASPRHADGIVITGPITKNMAEPLELTYLAVPKPKIIILAGTDAISGGIFEDGNALDRSFLQRYPVDLYVPGNPVHPLTFINGVLDLIRARELHNH